MFIRALFKGIVFLHCIIAEGQQVNPINGIWKGQLTQGPGGCFAVYNIELLINISGNKITGASFHYADITNYVKEEFEGSFDPQTARLAINELKVLTFKVPADCIPCIKQYRLNYTRVDQKEVLNGEWGGVTMNNGAHCPPGKIVLTRTDQSAFEEIDETVPLIIRQNELVREIKVDSGEIRLDFYDNGQIDGDTISVFVNKKPVIINRRLTEKPSTITIKVNADETEHEVVMVAENLGSIPPNTALMLVTAGLRRYQLYLTSTEKKNAMVRFVLDR